MNPPIAFLWPIGLMVYGFRQILLGDRAYGFLGFFGGLAMTGLVVAAFSTP